MSSPRFDDFRQIAAKFPSVGRCGHPIKASDVIGYHRRYGAMCPQCWKEWVQENREAAACESGCGCY